MCQSCTGAQDQLPSKPTPKPNAKKSIKYNLKKVDWKEFNKYLKSNSSETKQQIQQLLNNYKFNQAVQCLQKLIQSVYDLNISKLKISAQLKL